MGEADIGRGMGPRRHWRERAAGWCSPFTAPVPDAVRGLLIRVQHDRLRRSLPFLAVAIAANAAAMALALRGDLPAWQQLVPPAIVIGACLVVLAGTRRRARRTDEAAACRALRGSLFVTVPLGLVSGLWCVNAFTEMEEYYCMTAPVFLGIAALVGANGLAAVPRAAIGGMMAAVLPIAVKLASYSYPGLRAMAAMLVVIAIMQARALLRGFRETVELLTAQQELDRLAQSDALTGLSGRRAFLAALEARLAERTPVVVALADLDGFKQANDTHGHGAGDMVLTGVADRLRAAVPDAAMIARLGGDEFALLFEGEADAARIDAAIEAARHAIARPFAFGEAWIAVTVSIGIAASPADGTDLFALLHTADLAMYADKAARRAIRVGSIRRAAA